MGDSKLGGSAQRRLKKSLLQHGSLLLKRSVSAPELPGLEDLTGVQVQDDAFVSKWTHLLASALRTSFTEGSLRPAEKQAAEEYRSTLFQNDTWTKNR